MKRLISAIVSLGILIAIYTKIDFAGLIEVFRDCDRLWMAISLGMVVPLTLATSWRLQRLMPESGLLGFGMANRLTLAASVLNMVLPSKMGDIAKAYFIRDRGYLSGSLSLSLVVFEKACDMLSLLLWCAFGLLVYPEKGALFWLMAVGICGGLIAGTAILGSSRVADFAFGLGTRAAPGGAEGKVGQKLDRLHASWTEMQTYFWRDRGQLAVIAATSIGIWLLHLLQIWFFIFALNASVPFIANLALSPLSILAGLLPLTFAGVGTRDAALIFFYQPYFDAQTGAALGLLCTSRYILPAIGGLPFFGQFLSRVRSERAAKTATKP
ncbi:MAG: lysylphosphatidylglycerol synthase transmembrane domain-containing protein [Geitlerinemataceae cyanobacterium]